MKITARTIANKLARNIIFKDSAFVNNKKSTKHEKEGIINKEWYAAHSNYLELVSRATQLAIKNDLDLYPVLKRLNLNIEYLYEIKVKDGI